MAITKVKPTVNISLKTEDKKIVSGSKAYRVVAIDPKMAKPKPIVKELYIDQKELKKAKEAMQLESIKKEEKKTKETTKSSTGLKIVGLKKPLEIPPAPIVSKPSKVVYHISLLDKTTLKWKLFAQGSKSIIQTFDSQKEALDYAMNLCNKRRNGSYVLLHGIDGKITKH